MIQRDPKRFKEIQKDLKRFKNESVLMKRDSI